MGHQSFFETEKSPQTRMNTKKNVPDSKIRHIIWLLRTIMMPMCFLYLMKYGVLKFRQ